MDFWSRLIGGVGSSPVAKQLISQDPQRRLARFQKAYAQILQTWRGTSSTVPPASIVARIVADFQRINAILREESRTPIPHPSLAFASQSKFYRQVAEIASNARDEAIIREAIAIFSSLMESEEEEFPVDDDFTESVMSFLRGITSNGSMMVGVETEGAIVGLLFGIATKIRLQPETLPMWFTTRCLSDEGPGLGITNGTTESGNVGRGGAIGTVIDKHEDFPLFYLLIDYVHHEGRVGDFARTGLLYLIESASHSAELETWLVQSDLATLMASGLGALYSQLSRKLVLSYTDHDLPVILALSDYSGPSLHLDAETSTSLDFLAHLTTFLSYLLFWQDVLEHCKSLEVKQTLLDHFQVIFLEQLLYPSLLESSDVDGGSSVAVLTYLGRMLDALSHPDLVHLILQYLLALPSESPPLADSPTSLNSPQTFRRRQSLDLLTKSLTLEDKPSPSLFSLVDLILTSLSSSNTQTITATLRLLTIILRKHHIYAISTLLRTTPIPAPSATHLPRRTIGSHGKEMDMLLSLVARIGVKDDLDGSYESHVVDSMNRLESHPCSLSLLAVQTSGDAFTAAFTRSMDPRDPHGDFVIGARESYYHVLPPSDPLLQSLIRIMRTFFVNPVEINLSLTETIVELASCGYLALEGWLVVDPSHYAYPDASALSSRPKARAAPSWPDTASSPVFAALTHLLAQIDAYRHEIPDFDTHLAERKAAFHVSDELSLALISPPSRSFPLASTPSVVNTPQLNAIPITPRISGDYPSTRMPETVSRSSSPLRGRQLTNLIAPSPVSKLQNLNPSLYRSPAPASPISSDGKGRTFSPDHSDAPTLSALGVRSPIYHPRATTSNAAVLRGVIGLPTVAPGAVGAIQAAALSQQMERMTSADTTAASSTGESSRSASVTREEKRRERKVTVSHLLTNVIILQEFLLEIAALIQGRVGLYGEVRFV